MFSILIFLFFEVVDGRGADDAKAVFLVGRRRHTAVPSIWRYIARGTTLAIPLWWLFCERLEVSLVHSRRLGRGSLSEDCLRVWLLCCM
jgi:hypothetical protein